jgi:hypothetical protein
MKALSQSEYGELRSLYEQMYAPKEELEINEELINEISDELVEEFIEEGYSEEDAIEIVDEAIDFYVDAVLCEASDSYYDSAVRASKKAAKGLDKAARQKRRAGQARYYKRKAGEVLKRAGDKVKGAVAGAQIAGSIAKDEAKRASRKAVHSATKTADAVKSAPGKAMDKSKKGIKGFIKRQAQRVVNRMSEENVEELYKGKHGQSEKEYMDSRSDAGKQISGDSKQSGAAYSHRSFRGQGKPAKPGERQKAQGRMTPADRNELAIRKAALKKEELEATGLFTVKEIEAIMEAEMSEGYKEIDAKKHGRMYDRYKKLRSAAMQDARDSGEASGTNRMKMGKMSAVIDKSSENLRKKQTKDQLTGRG